ncbi:cytochrome P450 2W1 [Prionailurus iriomotensis]
MRPGPLPFIGNLYILNLKRPYQTMLELRKDTSIAHFSDENLAALVSNPLVASTETTASTLHWELLLMMRYTEVQKGTEVITLLTSVLCDQTQWEKPNTFNPEHFLSSTGKFIKKEAFMHFSVGVRMCVGESLAKMELFLFFTSLMQKFAVHPSPKVSHLDLDLTPDIGFTTQLMPHKIYVLL